MGILLSQIVLAKQQNFWIFLAETTSRFVEQWKAKGEKSDAMARVDARANNQ